MEKAQVLVLDDQAGVRLVISEALGRYNYRVKAIGSPKKAVEIVREDHPRVILLDQYILEGSGLALARQIKKEHPEIEIVLMSALLDDTVMENARHTGVSHFISKPFDLFELVDLVAGFFDKTGSERNKPATGGEPWERRLP